MQQRYETIGNKVQYRDTNRDDLEIHKKSFERDQERFEALMARKAEIGKARDRVQVQINQHADGLLDLEIAKVSGWVAVKQQLSGQIEALDAMLLYINAQLDRATIDRNQSREIYYQVKARFEAHDG